MFVLHAFGAHRGQKKTLNPLEVELEVVVSHHVGRGNHTQVLCKTFAVILKAELSLQPSD